MDRTYILRDTTVARIDAAALRLHLSSKSNLVDHLLSFALDALESGALTVPLQPTGYSIVGKPD